MGLGTGIGMGMCPNLCPGMPLAHCGHSPAAGARPGSVKFIRLNVAALHRES